QMYLKETQGMVPPYIVVSQVWGEIMEKMVLPGIYWGIPISDKKKWECVLDYCRRTKTKWLWMDIICINQAWDNHVETEKALEIPKMSQYYQEASACLVIPENYEKFHTAYACIMDILSRIADTGASVQDNARSIWDNIAMLEAVVNDGWFSRVWTYQELLLPKKHVLLDGQELCIDKLGRILGWYYKILRNQWLKKPEGGKDYSFVYPENELVFERVGAAADWEAQSISWDAKRTLQRDGHLKLLTTINITSWKNCKFPVDRMLGIYGLLKDEDRVSTLNKLDTAADGKPAAAGESALDTVTSAITSGRVWPLLYDTMRSDAPTGTNWMPRIIHASGCEVHIEILDHGNWGKIELAKDGLHMMARVVGRLTGVSGSIGDGGGEVNVMIACAWTLVVKGFDPQPILELFKEGLATSDTVPQQEVANTHMQIGQALHAPSLLHCFHIVEQEDLRSKLRFAHGIPGWNRAVFSAQTAWPANGTYVFLGWIYSAKTPNPDNCWILDVTLETQTARRWMIANKTGRSTFHKIGMVYASSLTIFKENPIYRHIVLD
ncbi:hypothetical protein BKA82DRAFT_3964912, partial [Pisolithus tinctorius]